MVILHTPRMCNLILFADLLGLVHSFTESYLSDTDNIAPFENTTPINLIDLLCVFLF